MSGIPVELLPIITWTRFFYSQQDDYTRSKAWQTWFIGGNGTGKTLLVYSNDTLQMLGIHHAQVGPPPVKVRVLVPSFDYVRDVALEKLQMPQLLKFQNISDSDEAWLNMLIETGAGKDFTGTPFLGTDFLISLSI